MAQGRVKVQVTPPNKVPGSYSSGKFVARAAAGRARAGLGQGFRRMGQDGAMRPMLATRGTRVPTGPEWLHEVKWDGMRVLASVTDGRLRLLSRNENDVTVSFPELAALAAPDVLGGHDIVLDGEIVAFTDGVPVFGALADRMHVRNARRAEA